MAELRMKVLGRLECATTIIPAQHLLPPFLEQLSETHPGLQVVLHVSGSREVESTIMNGRFELGITMSPTIPDELEGVEIGRDELQVVLSPRHVLARQEKVTPAEVSAETLIMREPASGTRVFIESIFSELRLPIRYGPELNNNEVIKSLVAAGVGIAILSTRAVAEDVRAERLCAVKLDGRDLSRPIRVVAKKAQALTPAAKIFRTLLLSFTAPANSDRLAG
jgi:DNA-binding transcriptional LysR family regulator